MNVAEMVVALPATRVSAREDCQTGRKLPLFCACALAIFGALLALEFGLPRLSAAVRSDLYGASCGPFCTDEGSTFDAAQCG